MDILRDRMCEEPGLYAQCYVCAYVSWPGVTRRGRVHRCVCVIVCGPLGTSEELRVTEVCEHVGTCGWLGVRVGVGQCRTNTAL